MSRKILGLDVRYNSISAVIIDSSLREKQIQSFRHIPVPETGEEDKETAMLSAIETMLGQMDTTGCTCVSSFPAQDISYRNTSIPFKGEKKINQVLPFELEPMLPCSVDELIIDFHPVNTNGNSEYTDIIAASVEKTKLQTYLDILGAAGTEPKNITIGSFPYAGLMSTLDNIPQNWILVDLQNNHAAVFIIYSGRINLIRSFPLAGLDIEKLLYQNLIHTITAFEETLPQEYTPEQIYLTGNALKNINPGQEADLETAINIPVTRADLLSISGISINTAQRMSWKPDEMDGALALALAEAEGINRPNFRKGPFALRKNWETHKSNLIKAGIFSLILLLFLGLNIVIDSYSAQEKLDRLDREINEIFKSTLPEVTKIVDPLHQMKVAMDEIKKSTFVPGDTGSSVRVIDILNELSRQVPKDIDVEFTRLVADRDNILISGNTDTFNSVDIIQTKIDKSDLFKKVTINSTKKDKTENRVQFKMKVDL